VPRLQYRAAARRDIAEIAAYIEQESQSRAVADALVQSITAHCEHLATLSSMIGRPRPELRAGYRSVTFGNYVIFLRYENEDGPRSDVYIIRILHGARDLDAYFKEAPGGDDA
jgi:plasmid stabilization system protein ParE